ncbi:MAG TPA: hypothetical protein VFI06_10190, partial [Chitinophagaceae bacterium]|nr:hypothetical protein [Chitinophagaceae bacterium]
MKKIILTALCFFSLATAMRAQVNFTFLPELYGRSIDGLGNFQVQNIGTEKIDGVVFITVKENSAGPVVVVITPRVTINPGLNNFPKSVFSNSSFRFSPGSYGAMANQTRGLPPGDYNFCFRFVPLDKSRFNEYETCFDGDIQPLVPLTLLNPADRDSICNKRPVLSWQPPLPFSAAMRFRLLLTEKRTGEGVADLLMKTPLLLLDNISSTTINYPSANPELKEGKTYYWQVVAYEKGVVISKSEIWEFTVQCKEPEKPVPNDSYRELKLLVNGNYYIANRAFRFSFTNDYGTQKLRYVIVDVDNDGKEVKNLPEVTLEHGMNKISIDLADLDLSAGGHYILKVYPFNEPRV